MIKALMKQDLKIQCGVGQIINEHRTQNRKQSFLADETNQKNRTGE